MLFILFCCCFFFKQKTAYEMRISDWSSDVCSSDLPAELASAISEHVPGFRMEYLKDDPRQEIADSWPESIDDSTARHDWNWKPAYNLETLTMAMLENISRNRTFRSEEHTSELQSLMRISYAVFCLTKKKQQQKI